MVNSMIKEPITKDGLEKLKKELENLKNIERPKIVEAISEARSHGDLKENAEYHAAKEQQAMNEAKISDLEDKLSRADVNDITKLSGNIVKFGAMVTVIVRIQKKKLSIKLLVSLSLISPRV